MTLQPGTHIGKYVVRRKLAEGGMAEIYLCSQLGAEGVEKDVVIKRIRASQAKDPEFIQMFIDEARLASRLNHSNLVQIFDFAKHEDTYFIAMEYVHGHSLQDARIEARQKMVPMPPSLVAYIGVEIAKGLEYAHRLTERGVPLQLVHRDVSPHNILLSFSGDVKLTDFGIAKSSNRLTAPGTLKGKFAYMSPEQARGAPVDARTDVFALGVVLWEMLTGGRLFDGDSDVAVLAAVQERAITPPARLNTLVPAKLDAAVMRALERDKEKRFQTAGELARALQDYIYTSSARPEDTSVASFLHALFGDPTQGEPIDQTLPPAHPTPHSGPFPPPETPDHDPHSPTHPIHVGTHVKNGPDPYAPTHVKPGSYENPLPPGVGGGTNVLPGKGRPQGGGATPSPMQVQPRPPGSTQVQPKPGGTPKPLPPPGQVTPGAVPNGSSPSGPVHYENGSVTGPSSYGDSGSPELPTTQPTPEVDPVGQMFERSRRLRRLLLAGLVVLVGTAAGLWYVATTGSAEVGPAVVTTPEEPTKPTPPEQGAQGQGSDPANGTAQPGGDGDSEPGNTVAPVVVAEAKPGDDIDNPVSTNADKKEQDIIDNPIPGTKPRPQVKPETGTPGARPRVREAVPNGTRPAGWATLRLKANPWANVWISGRSFQSVEGAKSFWVAPGTYRVRFQHQGTRETMRQHTITLKAGGDETLEFFLGK